MTRTTTSTQRLIAALAVLAALLGGAVSMTSAQSPTAPSVEVTGQTVDTISLRWTAISQADSYMVIWREQGNRRQYQMKPVVPPTSAHTHLTTQITGLAHTRTYIINVQPMMTSTKLTAAEIEATTAHPPMRTSDKCPQVASNDGTFDYDADNDGLIEICNLKQLDAIRHDLDGDGTPDQAVLPDVANLPADFAWGDTEYYAGKYIYYRGDFSDARRMELYDLAFPNPATSMGCPSTGGCTGYELAADLDFATNTDHGTGAGWQPIMGKTYTTQVPVAVANRYTYLDVRFYPNTSAELWVLNRNGNYQNDIVRKKMFTATFEGNGHIIANLHINRPDTLNVGLFGVLGPPGEIRNVGLLSPRVTGMKYVGALVGWNVHGRISGSYARNADVRGYVTVGGLVGMISSDGALVSEGYVTGQVNGQVKVGGITGLQVRGAEVEAHVQHMFSSVQIRCGPKRCEWIGGIAGFLNQSGIENSYTTSSLQRVDASDPKARTFPTQSNGGLAGFVTPAYHLSRRLFKNTYVTGKLLAPGYNQGAVVGYCAFEAGSYSGPVWDSYWDSSVIGKTSSPCTGSGTLIAPRTTDQLQMPTSPPTTVGEIYHGWGPVDIDGTSYPIWDFGASDEYPILQYCGPKDGLDLTSTGATEYCPLKNASQWGRTLN